MPLFGRRILYESPDCDAREWGNESLKFSTDINDHGHLSFEQSGTTLTYEKIRVRNTLISKIFTHSSQPVSERRLPSHPIYTLSGHEGAITALTFDYEGDYILTAGEDRVVILWNAKDGKLVKKFHESHHKSAHPIRAGK